MGYTHYFKTLRTPDLTWEELQQCRADIQKVLDSHKNIIQFDKGYKYPTENSIRYESDSNDDIGKLYVRFNGIGDDAHETFVFDNKEFSFCKTARKPYDIVVCKVLLILNMYFENAFCLTSDGFSSFQPEKKYKINNIVKFKDLDGNWGKALKWFRRAHGVLYKFRVDRLYGDGDRYFSYHLEL